MADTPASPVTVLEEEDDAVVVRVQCGDLDENHVKSLRAELVTAGEGHRQPFIVDVSRVKFVPSLSIGVLVRIASDFRARGQRIMLVGLQPTVRKVLAITQIDRIFEIQESVDAALRTLRV